MTRSSQVRMLGLTALLGSVAGAITALGFPSVVLGKTTNIIWVRPWLWPWLPLFAGAIHGALSAVISVGLTLLFWRRKFITRLVGLVLAWCLLAWLVDLPLGFIGCFLIDHTRAVRYPPGEVDGAVAYAVWGTVLGFLQPFHWTRFSSPQNPSLLAVAGTVYVFFLSVCRGVATRRLAVHLGMGIVSGLLAALDYSNFPLFAQRLNYGITWGVFVGFGVWKIQTHSRSD